MAAVLAPAVAQEGWVHVTRLSMGCRPHEPSQNRSSRSSTGLLVAASAAAADVEGSSRKRIIMRAAKSRAQPASSARGPKRKTRIVAHRQLPKDDGHRSVHLRIIWREGSAGRDDAGDPGNQPDGQAKSPRWRSAQSQGQGDAPLPEAEALSPA
eukprot:s2779_g4.t1